LAIPDVPLGVGSFQRAAGYQLLQLDLESKIWTKVETQVSLDSVEPVYSHAGLSN
jgi:hypothetical protein